MARMHELIPVTEIEGKISLVRGKRVLLDHELAVL
jgi:hypothetical protein